MAVDFLVQVVLSITYYVVSSLFLVVLAVLGYAAVLYLSNKRYYDINAKLPGWKKWPIVGDALHFRLDNIGFHEDLRRLLSTRRDQGVFNFMLGVSHYVIPTNAFEVEKILSSSELINKGKEYNLVTPWLGISLLTGGGSFWRSRRKLLTPSFHFNILKGFLPVINEVSNNLRELLLKHVDTDVAFDITPYISHASHDIINETAMGTKLDSLNDHNSDYVENTIILKDIVLKRFLQPHLWSKIIFDLTSVGRTHNALVEKMHAYTIKVINDRREAKRYEVQSAKYKAFLDTLLDCTTENGKPLTDEEIRAEVDTLMFEGHDTTSSALDYCIYLLASHKEEQQKCQEELDEIFSGHTVSAGTNVSLLSRHLHTDPKYFPDPEKFDPTRFLPENSIGRHPYAYIPFSAGPRNCIGQKLAMMEMKVVMTMLLRNFNISTSQTREEVIDNPGVVLESVSGIWIKLTTRN